MINKNPLQTEFARDFYHNSSFNYPQPTIVCLLPIAQFNAAPAYMLGRHAVSLKNFCFDKKRKIALSILNKL